MDYATLRSYDADVDRRGREAGIMADRRVAAEFATAALKPPGIDFRRQRRYHYPDGSTWVGDIGPFAAAAPTPPQPPSNDNADGGGLRHDAGKTRMELLPFDGLESAAEVLTVGAEKYAPRNWERGMSWMKCVGCLMRHLTARMAGQKIDPESGKPHLAHVVVNALFLLTYELRGIGADDLAPPVATPNLA